jgi:outer membrane protein assembly factor BamB
VLYQGKIYTGSRSSLFCLDAGDGTVQWELERNDDVQSHLSVFAGVLFAGDDSKEFYAVRPDDGSVIWSVFLNGDVRSAPAYKDGIVYISDDAGAVYALNAADGSVVWAEDLSANGVTMALVDDVLYFLSSTANPGGSQSIAAHRIADGSLIWRTNVNGFAFNSPAISGNTLVMGTDGNVYGLNRTTGDIIWNTEVATALVFRGSPAIVAGKVYIGNGTNAPGVIAAYLARMDLGTGEVDWTITISGQNRFGIRSSVVVGQNVVIAVADQAGLLAFDTETGDLLWNFTPNAGFQSSSAIVSGSRIFFQDEGGSFYCLGN